MKEVRISFVGDIFPANRPYTIGWGVASTFKKHYGTLWNDSINSIFTDSDICFANLESPLLNDENFSDQNCFAGHKRFVELLKKHRINIVSIANNHMLEHGSEGFYSTCETLRKNEIKYVGQNENGLSNIQIIKVHDISMGFCGFNEKNGSNIEFLADLKEINIFNTIKKLNSLELDFKIVSLHWGEEYIHYPSLQQINLAHKIIDGGVDIIIGHHSHTIQPVEEYQNGIIFYSLGNFIFDMLWSNKVRNGLIGKVHLFKNKRIEYELVGARIKNSYVPIKNDRVLRDIKKINFKFEKKINAIDKNPIGYERKYKWIHFFNHTKERVLMKISFLKNFRKLNKKSKKYFLKRIIKR